MHKKNLHVVDLKNLYNVATTMKLIINKFFSFFFIFFVFVFVFEQ